MRYSLLSLSLLSLVACVQAKPKTVVAQPTKIVEIEPIRITAVTQNGEIRSEAYDAKTLFEEASETFTLGDYANAITMFQKVYHEFEESPYANPSRYNTALALESLEKWSEALTTYQELLQREPDGIPTRFRITNCLQQLGRAQEALETLTTLESRSDLSSQQTIELHARKAQALFVVATPEDVLAESQAAIKTYDKIREQEQLETDYYISMAHFYEAKAYGAQGKNLPIRINGGKKQVEQDLDTKAELLLKAQSSFIRVLKLGNRLYATMAGFEIGLLYEEFYLQIKNAPVPNELTTDLEKQVYAEVLAKETKILLEKALRIYEKNVLLGERIGLQNDFIKQSQMHIENIKSMLTIGDAPPLAPASKPVEEKEKPKPTGKKSKQG